MYNTTTAPNRFRSVPVLRKRPRSPSYHGLTPASATASRVGAGNQKRNTAPELLLRRALFSLGARYRIGPSSLPGRPDIAFLSSQVAVFCDGDFWHGRDWPKRKEMLARGNNSRYWVAKIQRNIDRDKTVVQTLTKLGWLTLRVWEGDIRNDPNKVAKHILRTVARRRGG